MKLKSKILWVVTLATMTCALLFAMAAWLVLRSLSDQDMHRQGQMAAELMRMTVTHEMDDGKPAHIRPYLNKLNGVPGLLEARVVPAESVLKLMKLDGKPVQPSTELEKKVFQTAKPQEEVSNDQPDVFHYAIPYLATSNEASNCLKCHVAREGEVLGVVSLALDVSAQRRTAFWSVTGIAVLSFLFGTFIVIAFRRMLHPIVKTTEELNSVLKRAEAGDFSGRLQKRSQDEVGDIADKTNHFMQILEDSFGHITKQVEGLAGCSSRLNSGSVLVRTVRVINNLVSASHFKQAIENDRDLADVYARLGRVLSGQFGLMRYSLYETSNSNKSLTLISAKGLPEQADLWCDREITLDCDACRAKRTAQVVSSVLDDQICSAFCGNKLQSDEPLFHVCLPIMLSGSVGGVLQVVCNQAEADQVQDHMLTLRAYLDEAAPVIDAKRLMQSLKDAAMRDPMTRLYNRRFLEGYLDTLLATVQRQKISVGILMCDVDFFKQVNDTFGHETGDKVLITVAEILKRSVRASDLVIRFGGEEFVAVLVGAGEERAMAIAEQVRKTMEAHVFQTGSGPLKKTISVGVSLFPQDGDAFWACVKYADVAMYQAKETGRNKVLRFTREMWKEGDSSY